MGKNSDNHYIMVDPVLAQYYTEQAVKDFEEKQAASTVNLPKAETPTVDTPEATLPGSTSSYTKPGVALDPFALIYRENRYNPQIVDDFDTHQIKLDRFIGTNDQLKHQDEVRFTDNYFETYRGDAGDYAKDLDNYYKQQWDAAAYLINNYEAYRAIDGDQKTDENIKAVYESLDMLRNAVLRAKQHAEYWSQFENEAAYSAAMFNNEMATQYAGSSLSDINTAMEDIENTGAYTDPALINRKADEYNWLQEQLPYKKSDYENSPMFYASMANQYGGSSFPDIIAAMEDIENTSYTDSALINWKAAEYNWLQGYASLLGQQAQMEAITDSVNQITDPTLAPVVSDYYQGTTSIPASLLQQQAVWQTTKDPTLAPLVSEYTQGIPLALSDKRIQDIKVKRNQLASSLSGTDRNRANTLNDVIDNLQQDQTNTQKKIELEKTLQLANKYNAYLDTPDFAKYTEMGAAIENPSYLEGEGGLYLAGWRPFAKDVGNIVTYSRDNYDQLMLAAVDGGGETVGNLIYHFMTDDEVNIYNYLLTKEGNDAAQEYLDFLEETLNYRFGNMQAENISNIDSGIGRTLMTGAYGVGAGLDQFGSGLRQLFSSERLPTTATQYGSASIRESLSENGVKLPDWMGGASLAQAAYDLTTTVGNELPSILLTVASGGLGAPAAAIVKGTGAIIQGASAMGNAYNQSLLEGYSKEQARNYAILIGASEAGLQYAFDAIGGAANKAIFGKTAQMAIKNIDSTLLRVGANIGFNLNSNGLEEYMQEILTPVFRNSALDEDNEFKLFTPDAVYSYVLGAVIAGVLDSGSIIATDIDFQNVGSSIQQAGKTKLLLESALAFDTDSETYNLAIQMETGLIHKNDVNIGELFKSYIYDGGTADILAPNENDIIYNTNNGNALTLDNVTDYTLKEQAFSDDNGNDATQNYINKAVASQNNYVDKGVNTMNDFVDKVTLDEVNTALPSTTAPTASNRGSSTTALVPYNNNQALIPYNTLLASAHTAANSNLPTNTPSSALNATVINNIAETYGKDVANTLVTAYGSDVVKVLAAYGGDVTKALEAAKHTTDELLNADIVTDWNSKAQSAVSNAKSDSSWDDVIRDALAGHSETGYNGNDPILKMLSDLNQARASGMTAREFALNKGVPSTLSDADAAILDEFDFKLFADDAAKRTESDWDNAFKEALADQTNTGGGAGEKDLFRGDDLLYEEKRPNGISKSYLNSAGDLVPANVDGLYKDRQVTVTEHILGGYRKGAKGNSPYTSFTNDKGIVANYGNSIIKVDLDGLIRDINAGNVRGVEVLTPGQVQALITSDIQESEYWRDLAFKWAMRDNEYLIKGIIPEKYITIITGGGK